MTDQPELVAQELRRREGLTDVEITDMGGLINVDFRHVPQLPHETERIRSGIIIREDGSLFSFIYRIPAISLGRDISSNPAIGAVEIVRMDVIDGLMQAEEVAAGETDAPVTSHIGGHPTANTEGTVLPHLESPTDNLDVDTAPVALARTTGQILRAYYDGLAGIDLSVSDAVRY